MVIISLLVLSIHIGFWCDKISIISLFNFNSFGILCITVMKACCELFKPYPNNLSFKYEKHIFTLSVELIFTSFFLG